MLRSHGFPRAWARAQGLVGASVVASAAVALGCALGTTVLFLPGLAEPIPVVRVFPAVIASCGAVGLLEPWRSSELVSARSPFRLRAVRLCCASTVVVLSGAALGLLVASTSLLPLTVAAFALLTLGVSTAGRYWWFLVAPALYGQLYAADVEDLHLPLGWLAVGFAVAAGAYVRRGETLLGSPT